MNFFKAVFSDDPQSSDHNDSHSSISDDDHDIDQSDAGGAWSFGGLIKTLASKSESVIDTYRKDLEDFGSGIRKETAVILEAANRAVEVGAFVAQESLESFGQAIDDVGSKVWEGTAEIIAHGKDSILAVNHEDSGSSSEHDVISSKRLNFEKYSRIEALIRAMQCDENTYREKVGDKGDYDDWIVGFDVGEKGSEIMDLIAENEAVEGIYKKLVPKEINHETFWCRYYYKLHKLKQVEEAREKLVKRALAGVEDEDLSWDVDDDKTGNDGRLIDDVGNAAEKCVLANTRHENLSDANGATVGEKMDECDSVKDSDFSVVSTQPSFREEEEDLGWDEIEDIESHDEGRYIQSRSGGSPSKVDMRKHPSAAEDDEDLSWDIEDDDGPPKP